jgi:hypothetical protein
MLPKEKRDIVMGKLSMELYLDTMAKKYKTSTRRQKSEILEEFCAVSGYHKKYAIRLLNERKRCLHRGMRKGKETRGRPEKYPPHLYLEPLKQIWLSTEQLCGKRLKMALPLWLPHYSKTYGQLDDAIYQGLLKISAATIDRMLASARVKCKRGLSGTKPGKILKKHIPIKTNQWNEEIPGFLEADTVAHCGTSLAGSFVWSLTLTDIYSAWTELRAVWNKGADGVLAQIQDIENSLPFEMLGFDSDNGSEFLNWHLIRYFSNEQGNQRIQFTRSRPYHSDDNAHVEQKNWTHVRQLFGYERFSNQAVVALMNDLYKNEISLMNNYFLPNTKLKEKQRIQSKILKKHDKPATPYQRLMSSKHIPEDKKKELTNTYNNLDPFELKKNIKRKVDQIFRLINKDNGKKMCYI